MEIIMLYDLLILVIYYMESTQGIYALVHGSMINSFPCVN